MCAENNLHTVTLTIKYIFNIFSRTLTYYSNIHQRAGEIIRLKQYLTVTDTFIVGRLITLTGILYILRSICSNQDKLLYRSSTDIDKVEMHDRQFNCRKDDQLYNIDPHLP